MVRIAQATSGDRAEAKCGRTEVLKVTPKLSRNGRIMPVITEDLSDHFFNFILHIVARCRLT